MRHPALPSPKALFALILLAGVCGQAMGQSECRERARRLTNAAQRCRQRLASGELQTCTVTLGFRNDQEVSIEQAEALAAAFNRNADRYEALQRSIQAVRDKIALDQRAITMHGFTKQERDFEDWVELSSESQKEFEDSVVSGAIDTALLGVKVGSTKLASLSNSKVDQVIKEAKALGMEDSLFYDALKACKAAKNRKAAAKAIGEAMERLQKAKDKYQMAKDRNGLKATATILGWCVEDPKLTLLVTEVDITIAAIFNNATRRVSMSQIEALNKLTEGELKGIKAVSGVIKEHVSQLQSLKTQLRQVPGCY